MYHHGNDSGPPPQPSGHHILAATGAAFAVAMLAFVAIVMPAEFGRDPLGVGELTGLMALSRPPPPYEPWPEVHGLDDREFELGPFQSVEYKYLMDLDAVMLYSWQADGELHYELHAEPGGLGEDAAVSFDIGDNSQGMGVYQAPFAGLHGWFWENRGFRTVLLRLHTAGYYHTATVFRDGGSYERQLEAVVSR